MSIAISRLQADYLVSLILRTTGHRHFLPGIPMNPLDRESLQHDEMDFIPFPLFEGQRPYRASDASSQYRRAVASLRARIESLEGELYSESASVHDGSRLGSERPWYTVQPHTVRGAVLLGDNYQEMTEEELRAHHYLLDSYRITYRRRSSINTSPPSPRTILTHGKNRRDSSYTRRLSEPLVNGSPRLPSRSLVLEPLPICEFTLEYPSGQIDTFYGSIYGIMLYGE